MFCSCPLRYQISDWDQLVDCKSNNSNDLSISVTKFIQNTKLSGTRILVNHCKFGTLFACMVSTTGSLISDPEGSLPNELSPAEILRELRKFGFLITFKQYENLSGNQIQYLMTLNSLGFDKIRILNIWHKDKLNVKVFENKVVAFNIKANPDWLNAGYSCDECEFNKSIVSGNAINISEISETNKFNWSWLYNWVADINDILECNGNVNTLVGAKWL